MTRRGRSRARTYGAYALIVLVLGAVAGVPAHGSNLTGSAGVNTAIPNTESAVTVRGRGPFHDLNITVNQTKNLLNQAVSITWTGAAPTVSDPSPFGAHYLQVMQCWGDDDGTNAINPGPKPERCAFGARNGVYGGVSGTGFPSGMETERIITRRGWPNYDALAGLGTLDARSGNVWRRFEAADGTVVEKQTDPTFNPSLQGGVYWQNPYFNVVTTNEVAGAKTLANGTGSSLFEVVTGIENAGLGCGQQTELVAGVKRVPKCWIVVVPRRDAETENQGTPFGPSSGVITSPLAPDQWQHRIAIPIEFNPVDTACKLGDDTRRLSGNELVLSAMSSWQPVLCATPGLRAYSYGIVSDAGARLQLLFSEPGSPGMYVVSRPVDSGSLDPDNPVVYAPLTLSGITIGFNIERVPKLAAGEEAQNLRGVRVSTLNLTPRLLAKVLTQSYVEQVNIQRFPGYEWVKRNPDHLGADEDFLRFNPEFRELEPIQRKHFGGLLLPAGNSDAAQLVWEYVLADPEARAWLDGQPDEWGMKVNPVYATTAAANSQGAPFAETAPNSFPKSDPYCYQAPKLSNGLVPPPLCGTDWLPYVQSMRDGARLTRAADDTSKLEANSFAVSPDRYYSRTPPQPEGGRTMLTLTDTPSANLFGLQTARLSRAGDDDNDRRFIAPDNTGLTAAIAGMTPRTEVAVLEPDPKADAPAGYPLATLTYGATRPLTLSAEERLQYAAFVDFASGPGQVPGPRYGELPLGFAPLPDALKTQSRVAAKAIRELQPTPALADEADGAVEPEPAPAAPEDPAVPPPAPASPRRATPNGTSSRSTTSAPAPAAPVVITRAAAVTDGGVVHEIVKLATTPGIATPLARFVLPVLVGIALIASLLALEITKRPRRLRPGAAAPPAPEDGDR